MVKIDSLGGSNVEKINSTGGKKMANKLSDNSYIPQDILNGKKDKFSLMSDDIKHKTKKSLREFTFSTTNDNSPFLGISGSDIGKTAGFKGDYKDDKYKVSAGLDMYTGVGLSKKDFIIGVDNEINTIDNSIKNTYNNINSITMEMNMISNEINTLPPHSNIIVLLNRYNNLSKTRDTLYLDTKPLLDKRKSLLKKRKDLNIKPSTSTRIDFAHINMTKKILDEEVHGFNLKGYLGGGINIIGNLGGKKVQDKWHNINYIPLNGTHYENILGFSPTINGSLEIDRIIYGTNKNGVSIYGNLDAQLALIHKYGSNNINATIGIKGEYEGFGVDVSRTVGYSSMPTASKTFKDLKLSGHISTTSMKLYAPLIKDLSVYFKVTKDNIQKSRQISDTRRPNSNTTKLNSPYQSELGFTYKF